MGGSEILLILLVILILFGADKLPELARSLGKGLNEVKKASDEIKNELLRHSTEIGNEVKELQKGLTENTPIDQMRKEIEGIQDNTNIEDIAKNTHPTDKAKDQ
ncbi:MAG TPA: twin-arginine translocase TatA/TatE family subunit [Bacteroidales bacterium]|nr:twin-arginine translocase TatA/TatE family subunit [Bacteroidales bacterium]HOK99445.1 twin-arginine translocase TatA/TatE family subunit [Bacteroidales bacterium]HPO66311.1 twin-arginine translocase TatA/TatE family subunit [Bacteroidales bacterium]